MGFTQRSRCIRKNAYKDQRAVQVFIILLDKATVMIVCGAQELIVELSTRVVGSSEEVWEEGRQCFKHRVLQANDNKKCGRKRSKVKGGIVAHAFGLMVASTIVEYKKLWFVLDDV